MQITTHDVSSGPTGYYTAPTVFLVGSDGRGAEPVRIFGSAVFLSLLTAGSEQSGLFGTALHLVQGHRDYCIIVPEHRGNIFKPQYYPSMATTLSARVLATDPFADLAILAVAMAPDATIPLRPEIAREAGGLRLGSEVLVFGYPFAPMGFALETMTPGFVTAIARRRLSFRENSLNVAIDELVLSITAHSGSSGSAVIGKRDGVLHGIVRGSLAPPPMVIAGPMPYGNDSSVTFATGAHLLRDLLDTASDKLGRKS